MYFNPCSGKVEDVTGRIHLVCVPDISILSVVEDLQRSIRPPELIETEGLKRVKSDRNVYVDPTDRKFRKSTGVWGLGVMMDSLSGTEHGIVFIDQIAG